MAENKSQEFNFNPAQFINQASEISKNMSDTDIFDYLADLASPAITFEGQHDTFVVSFPDRDNLKDLARGSLGEINALRKVMSELVDKPDRLTLADMLVVFGIIHLGIQSVSYIREVDEVVGSVYFDKDGLSITTAFMVKGKRLPVRYVRTEPITVFNFLQWYEGSRTSDIDFRLFKGGQLFIGDDEVPIPDSLDIIGDEKQKKAITVVFNRLAFLMSYYIFPYIEIEGKRARVNEVFESILSMVKG